MTRSTLLRTFSLSALAALTGFAAEPQFAKLEKAQREVLQCSIVERVPEGDGFRFGIDLGRLQLVQNTDRNDLPFELRYVFSEVSGVEYDFSTDDRFPSNMEIVQASELVIEDKADKTPEELEVDEQKKQLKEFLDYFQGVAAVPEGSEVYGYLIFSDSQNLSLSLSYISKEGELLGQGGLLYGNFRYACKQPDKKPEPKPDPAKKEPKAEEDPKQDPVEGPAGKSSN